MLSVDERPDPEIARDAVAAIRSQLPISSEHIKVVVKNGWVTLEGPVERSTQREAAERAVRNLMGVKMVVNKITVTQPKAVTGDVRKAIEQALERRAEREARQIGVDVRDGTVTLTGPVHSWAERKSVLAAARFTPGVRVVEDHLRTEPV